LWFGFHGFWILFVTSKSKYIVELKRNFMPALGKYELHEQLGKGGFGTVYRATDTSLDREVAIKVLHPQLMVDDTFVERFKKEAEVLASFDHPNIVTIFEMGELEGRAFIAMRYLSGGSL
jgi:eukaryotic-like serine/threonine-protein kinase